MFIVGHRHLSNWGRGTRACKFCHIATAKPVPLATIADEHDDILRAAVIGKYDYLVIASVARDDDKPGWLRISRAHHAASMPRALP
jgi:lipoate synthase